MRSWAKWACPARVPILRVAIAWLDLNPVPALRAHRKRSVSHQLAVVTDQLQRLQLAAPTATPHARRLLVLRPASDAGRESFVDQIEVGPPPRLLDLRLARVRTAPRTPFRRRHRDRGCSSTGSHRGSLRSSFRAELRRHRGWGQGSRILKGRERASALDAGPGGATWNPDERRA